MSQKYTLEYIKDFYLQRGYEYLENDYKNCKEKTTLKDADGYKYWTSFDGFCSALRGNHLPWKFSSSNIYTIDNISLWICTNKKPLELLESKYISARSRNLNIRCLKCGNKFNISWNDLDTGEECPNCRCDRIRDTRHRKTVEDGINILNLFPDIASEWDYENNTTLPEEYKPSSDFRANWICSVCGHKYPAAIKNRTRGNGCPKCKSSWGEKRIFNYLKENYIQVIPQYRIPECKKIKPLPFDFGIEFGDRLFLIEYHGEQHYRPINFFGGKTKFKERVENDLIKETFCKNNNIPLLIIPHWEYENIEVILDRELLGFLQITNQKLEVNEYENSC